MFCQSRFSPSSDSKHKGELQASSKQSYILQMSLRCCHLPSRLKRSVLPRTFECQPTSLLASELLWHVKVGSHGVRGRWVYKGKRSVVEAENSWMQALPWETPWYSCALHILWGWRTGLQEFTCKQKVRRCQTAAGPVGTAERGWVERGQNMCMKPVSVFSLWTVYAGPKQQKGYAAFSWSSQEVEFEWCYKIAIGLHSLLQQ